MKQISTLLLAVLIICGCQKNMDTPDTVPLVATLTTSPITSLTATTAVTGGNISSDGGSAVTARGICWGTTPNPVITGNHSSDGIGTGSFTSTITGLTASNIYYARAYATNTTGTAYGNEISFTTSGVLPTVTTTAITSVTSVAAASGGVVVAAGSSAVTARGVCWGTTANPDINGSHTSDGTGAGTFVSAMAGLNASASYYVRAYATNSTGTAYGSQLTFQTTSTDSVRFIFMGGDKNLYCFNGWDGSIKWIKTFTKLISTSPCYANGIVYTACEDGKLYAFDTLGNAKWSVVFNTNPPYYRFTPSVVNGLVFINNDRYVMAYDAVTGVLKWQYDAYTLGMFNYIKASVTVANGAVYINTGYLISLNAVTGNTNWTYFRLSMFIKPKVYNGKVYILDEGLSDQELRAVNAADGTLAWTKVLGYSSNTALSLNVVNNNIYLYKDGVKVYDTATRNVQWSSIGANYDYSFQGGSSPVVADGFAHIVIDGNINGKVYVYNVNTGVKISEYGGNIHESDITIANGVSYYGTRDIFNSYVGYLYAVKINPDGTPGSAWRSTVQSDFRTTPCVVTASGKMYRAGDSF